MNEPGRCLSISFMDSWLLKAQLTLFGSCFLFLSLHVAGDGSSDHENEIECPGNSTIS